MSTETALERVDPIAALAQKSIYETMDARQLAMLKATRMQKLSDVEIGTALELCHTLGLNPWNDEMYATKGNQGELLIMVGRNGLLRKAEEFPDYQGYDVGVVYENDVFEKVDPDPDAKSMRARAGVIHRQAHPKDRGACVGAWAVAERRGRPTRYFFAPLEDYMPSNPHAKSSWARTPTVMIEKVPISVVHRTLTNLSGVYLREEVDKMLERPDGGRVVVTAEEEAAAVREIVAELEGGSALHARLLRGIERMNALSPASWNLAKVQMTLPGRSAEELLKQAEEIEADIAREETRRPKADAEAQAEEITDAEVIRTREIVDGELEEARTALEFADPASVEHDKLAAEIGVLLDELDAVESAEEMTEPE